MVKVGNNNRVGMRKKRINVVIEEAIIIKVNMGKKNSKKSAEELVPEGSKYNKNMKKEMSIVLAKNL